MNKGRKHPPRSEEYRQKFRGANNHAWRGGTTLITDKIRLSDKYIEWRQQIFIRDNFTCQKCKNKSGCKLNAHHIKPFRILLREARDYIPLLDLYSAAMIYTPMWSLNNGQTLCERCHKKTRTYGTSKS